MLWKGIKNRLKTTTRKRKKQHVEKVKKRMCFVIFPHILHPKTLLESSSRVGVVTIPRKEHKTSSKNYLVFDHFSVFLWAKNRFFLSMYLTFWIESIANYISKSMLPLRGMKKNLQKSLKKSLKTPKKQGLTPRKWSSRPDETLSYAKTGFFKKKQNKNTKWHSWEPWQKNWLVFYMLFDWFLTFFRMQKSSILEPFWASESRLMLPKP